MRIFSVGLLMLASSCGSKSGLLLPPERTPVSVSVFAPDGSHQLLVSVGRTVRVSTFLKYAEGDSSGNVYQVWISQDTSIARAVSATGDILGVKTGSTVLHMLVNEKFPASIPITVQ